MFKPFITTHLLKLSLILLMLLPQSSTADVLSIREDAPKRYVVKKGDTLWDLSGIYLTKPWLWPKLWGWNPQIKNPHLIYPGDVISLTYDADGTPRLSINSKVKKLSPKTRVTLKQSAAIPTLPLKLIRPYLSYEQSLDGAHLDALPYVLGAAQSSKNWFIDQILYINSVLEADKTYAIYRKGKAYTNIGKNKPLGYQTELVGTAKVIRTGTAEGEPAAIRVVTALSEIKAGDKILPASEGQQLPAFFKITQPDVALDATIIASPYQYRQFSKYDVVVLNMGAAQQAKVGNLLNIYHQSPAVIDIEQQPRYYQDASQFDKFTARMGDTFGEEKKVLLDMPKERIGELVLFKVYQNISYALITRTIKPAQVGDTTFVSIETAEPETAEPETAEPKTAEPEDDKASDSWFYGSSEK